MENSLERRTVSQRFKKPYVEGVFKYIRILMHSVGSGQFMYATYYWGNLSYGRNWGRNFRFLTYLVLILHGSYYTIALLNDIFGSNAISPRPVPFLRKLRDPIFSVLAFPFAINVSLSFWIIYAYDRELIFAKSMETIFPNWLNQIAHSSVALFILPDIALCFRRYPERRNGILYNSIAMVSYIGWLHITRYHNGRWAYPLLNGWNTPMRYLMLTIHIGLNGSCYLLGEFLNDMFWEPELRALAQNSE